MDKVKFKGHINRDTNINEVLKWHEFTDSVNVLSAGAWKLVKNIPTHKDDREIEIIIREMKK